MFGFDNKYLKGRYFTKSKWGYKWLLRSIITQKILGLGNRSCKWPVSPFCTVTFPESIEFDPDDLNIFQTFGSYFMARPNGKIKIGKGTWIAPHVGIITQNHDLQDLSKAAPAKDVTIGANCWIGMNSMVLPGVTLGSHTTVGAGSVVTHSFPDGNQLIAGNPAKVIRKL
jgi:acetyltransferase-like isoleucine patch superfamily enzyme